MTDAISFSTTSPRFALPLLFSGQSQKEVTVNEALVRTDLLLHPVVLGTISAPPSAPTVGQCWIIGSAATDDFLGNENAIAAWCEGGWRLIAPQQGLQVYDVSLGVRRIYTDAWDLPAAPAIPDTGTTIDSEARATLEGLITALCSAGLLVTL